MKQSMLASVGVIALAAFAWSGASAKDYLSSEDGRTGAYFGASFLWADMDDVETRLVSGEADAGIDHETGYGGLAQFGYDFGKIRFDLRLGGLQAEVDDVDGAAVRSTSESAIGVSTLNLAWDIYRFPLGSGMAITPYVGGGVGVTFGWTNAKRESDFAADGTPSPSVHKRDKFDTGMAYSGEVGLHLTLTDLIGVNASYNYIATELGESTMSNHVGSAGIRLSF